MTINLATKPLDEQGLPPRDSNSPVDIPDEINNGVPSEDILSSERTAEDLFASCEQIETMDSPTGTTTSATSEASSLDWGLILMENEPWLRTVIAARVGETAAIDEVFQEVSLAAVRQQAPIHDRTKVCPWLYKLAVTQSLLYRRTMGRKKKLINRYTENTPIEEYDRKQIEPLEWLLDQERRTRVQEAMSALPKPQQELLMLKYVHDWSYRDMSEHLGITVSAVQAKLHRARGLLRAKLERMQVDYS